MDATISMYKTSDQIRVLVFGGLLFGMMPASEGEQAWARGFELARKLNVEIQRAFGYTGSLAQ